MSRYPRPVHLCSFASLAGDLTAKQASDADIVLAALTKNPNVSTFDMAQHRRLRDTIAELERSGKIERTPSAYPWHRWTVRT